MVGGPGLSAITCESANSCLAIGSYTTVDGEEGLIERLAKGIWNTEEAPLPANAATAANQQDVTLDAVVCPGGSCVAVGQYVVASTGDQPGLIEILSGTTWTPIAAPVPANGVTGRGAILYAITCMSAASCVAVGAYSANTPGGLIDTLSAGTWTATAAPVPAGGNGVYLDSIACPATDSCVAIGGYSAKKFGTSAGVIEALSGGTWSASTAPLPTGGDVTSSVVLGALGFSSPSVACVGGTCYGVGTYNNNSLGLVEKGPV
jgi:hypothetical protein